VVVLRVEDLDGPRVKKWAFRQTLEDLEWLGLDWDEGPGKGGDHGPYVQGERLDFYARILERLEALGRIYPCVCTRKEAALAASAPQGPGGEGPPYPGTCRGRFRSVEEARERTGRPAALRFLVREERVEFHDGFAGPVSLEAARSLGDFVVAKGDGTPSYQLACAADDHAMEITHVLRGDDLVPSAVRQILLHRALGWEPPRFAHTPLLVGPDGRRLAKRHGDTRVARFREAGLRPESLVGWLAAVSGLLPPGEEAMPADLVAGFDLAKVPREKVVVRLPLPFAPEITS